MKKIAIIGGCCIAVLGAIAGVLYVLEKMGKLEIKCLSDDWDDFDDIDCCCDCHGCDCD